MDDVVCRSAFRPTMKLEEYPEANLMKTDMTNFTTTIPSFPAPRSWFLISS
jgi:hypothetical protein